MEIKNDAQLRNLRGFLSNRYLISEFDLSTISNGFLLKISPWTNSFHELEFDFLTGLGFKLRSVSLENSQLQLCFVMFC